MDISPGSHETAAVSRLINHAFAGTAEGTARWLALAGAQNVRVTRSPSGEPASCLLLIPMGQFFGGRSIPMLGVAAVAVAPEERGKGHAKRMMQAFVRDSAAQPGGPPIAALYASTHSLYRAVGFEHAGYRFHYTVPLVRIDQRNRHGDIVSLAGTSSDDLKPVYDSFARRFDGQLDRGPYIWSRVRAFRDTEYHGFGVKLPDGTLGGYVFLHQDRKSHGRHDISLSDFAFTSPEVGRRLWGFLADFAMMGEDLSFHGGPTHPALTLLGQQRYKVECRDYWMIRILDVKRALEARGYSPAVRATVRIEITDDLVPGNAGNWTMSVADGRATVERTASSGGGTIRCDIRGLASMYSGFVTPLQAKLVGLADGDDATLNAAGAVFQGGTPWMTDMF